MTPGMTLRLRRDAARAYALPAKNNDENSGNWWRAEASAGEYRQKQQHCSSPGTACFARDSPHGCGSVSGASRASPVAPLPQSYVTGTSHAARSGMPHKQALFSFSAFLSASRTTWDGRHGGQQQTARHQAGV